MAIKGTVFIKGKKVEESKPVKAVVQSSNHHVETADTELAKLDTLVEETESTIYEFSSVFPFQLFPDRVIIDKNKVTVVRKHLFFKRIFPILLEDIRTVRVNRGIIFAAMEFEVMGYDQGPEPVAHLWPEQAKKAEEYLLGLIKSKRERVNLAKLSPDKIKKRLRGIGKMEEKVEDLF